MILNKKTGLELNKENGNYIFSFGQRRLNTDVRETFIVKGDSIKNVQSTVDCDCTSASPNVMDKNTVEIDIIYKSTHMLHTINREVSISYTENEQYKRENILITGQIIN